MNLNSDVFTQYDLGKKNFIAKLFTVIKHRLIIYTISITFLFQQDFEYLNLIHVIPMIFDLHSDYGWYLHAMQKEFHNPQVFSQYLQELIHANVKMEILQVGGDYIVKQHDFNRSENIYAAFQTIISHINSNSEDALIIKSKRDLDQVFNCSKRGFLLSIEGAGSIDGSLTNLLNYYQMGLRAIGITQNYGNKFADGCNDVTKHGLSNLGQNIIQQLNDLRIIIDLSHISEQSFFDVLALYNYSPLVSHSNVKSLCNHPRNLTDAQIIAIGEKGGVIGVTFVGPFVDTDESKVTINRVIDHIEYIEKLIGINHVGIGGDFIDYCYSDMRDYLNRYHLSLDGLIFPNGLQKAADFVHLIEHLQNRGFSSEEIRKITIENGLRIFTQILT